MNQSPFIAAVILAAGPSSRLGQPKQLIEIEGKPLLQRVIEAFLEAGSMQRIVVVLGANEHAIRSRLQNMYGISEVEWTANPNWNSGMGQSLAYGIDYVDNRYIELQHAVVSVCDQPFLDANLVRRLVKQSKRHPQSIIPSAYSGTVGPPVVFPRKYFRDLREVSGKSGAKSVILKHMERVIPVAFPKGTIDKDTISDIQQL